MKKSTVGIILLELALVGVSVAHSYFGLWQPKNIENVITTELSSSQVASFNYLLKYELPDGYSDVPNVFGEIAIGNETGESMFIANIINTNEVSPEDFINEQEQVIAELGQYSEVGEDFISENGRSITKKFYEVDNGFMVMQTMIATVVLDSNPNQFIAVIGNAISDEYIPDFESILQTVDFTTQTLDKPRLYSNENEVIEITMAPGWQRYAKEVPYSFCKQDDMGVATLFTMSFDKSVSGADEEYNTIKQNFVANGAEVVEEDIKTEDKNKTITTSIFKSGDTISMFTLVDFKNKNYFALVQSDFSTQEEFDTLKPEVDTIINSIKLK